METKQIDVMVADASHEVYVDKILNTIKEALLENVGVSSENFLVVALYISFVISVGSKSIR